MIPSWLDMTPQNIWTTIFKHFRNNSTQLVNLKLKLTEFAFSFAGTSTEVERIFSLMNNIWDEGKSRLEIDILDAFLTVQQNSTMTCSEFYENIKNNDEFLKKTVAKDKYNN